MKLKLNIKKDWDKRYQNQLCRINDWINSNSPTTDQKYLVTDKGPELLLFDEYLRGTDIAGVGQGRFSDNAKGQVKAAWKDIVPLLLAVKKAKDNELFSECESLQKKLIGFCKKKAKTGGKEVEKDEHKPWAAIHAMIVALRPDVFCTIVSEGNIDELFKKLSEAKDTDSEDGEVKDGTIDLKFDDAWKTLEEEWKEAKKHSKDSMSWYYKSKAIQTYYSKIVNSNSDWQYMNYPWETLVALRGEKNIETLVKKLEKQKNLILTGAPGTGKTYLAKKIASFMITGNSDFEDLKDDKKKDFELQFKFTQFHPSYDYTDFVEGLRPTNNNDENKKTIVFERMDGVFKDFCAQAIKDKDENHKYVFVIDEINRGEISKIFGELFYSIDPGYRGEKGKITTQYQNLIDKNGSDTFKDGFYVPDNVYVIGTMNDIDRSVESMDFAFRRRFAFIEVTAADSESIIFSKLNDGIDKQEAVDRMRAINKILVKNCGLTPQYQIGGSYFQKLNDVQAKGSDAKFKELWQDYLQGTLYEYFRGLPTSEVEEKMKQLKDAYDNGVDDE